MAPTPVRRGTVVCVTGAGGFVGGHLVASLLQVGATVRATVRDADSPKVAYLRKLPGSDDRLRLWEADLLSPGSFDEVVRGCSVVFHTASPFALFVDDAEKLLKPAVEGCLNVLRACAKAASVRRVVHTSSFITLMGAHGNDKPYTEKDHNTRSTIAKGHVYAVSKIRSEKACWAFMEETRPAFDLITIHPPMVLGPFLPGYAEHRRPSESSMMISNMLCGAFSPPAHRGMALVDVRDVAKMHIVAASAQHAQGRYLCAAGSMSYGDMAMQLQLAFPAMGASARGATPRKPVSMAILDTSKAARDLGFAQHNYTPLQETLRDQAQALLLASLRRLSKL